MKEAVSVKSVTKYGDVIEAVGDNMKTDMTFNEMKSFLEYAKGGMPEVDTISLKGYEICRQVFIIGNLMKPI